MNTHQATQEYTDIRCDNLVWVPSLHEHRRCNRLLFKVRAGENRGEVFIECPKCGKRQWATLDKAA